MGLEPDHFCKSQREVENLGVPALGDEDVGRFDVAVDDAFCVEQADWESSAGAVLTLWSTVRDVDRSRRAALSRSEYVPAPAPQSTCGSHWRAPLPRACDL
jgi:hypothetical protein